MTATVKLNAAPERQLHNKRRFPVSPGFGLEQVERVKGQPVVRTKTLVSRKQT